MASHVLPFSFVDVFVIEEACPGRQFLDATVKVMVAGEMVSVAGSGKDPISAMLDGLRKAVPAIGDLQLASWKAQYGDETNIELCFVKGDTAIPLQRTGPTLLQAVCAALLEVIEWLHGGPLPKEKQELAVAV